MNDGVAAVTDGPFTEAKEVLAGYYLLDCSLERATEIAARLPEARFSPIEIRAFTDPMPEDRRPHCRVRRQVRSCSRDLPASARRWDLRPASH